MKKDVSPVVIIGVVAVLVLIIGVVGFQFLGPHHSPGVEDTTMRNKYMPNYPYLKNEVTKPGQMPSQPEKAPAAKP